MSEAGLTRRLILHRRGNFPEGIEKRPSFFLAVIMLGAYFNRPGCAYSGLRIEDVGEIDGWRETVIRSIMAMMAAG